MSPWGVPVGPAQARPGPGRRGTETRGLARRESWPPLRSFLFVFVLTARGKKSCKRRASTDRKALSFVLKLEKPGFSDFSKNFGKNLDF